MKPISRIFLSLVLLVSAGAWRSEGGSENKSLDIYWTDVEGGAATLIVTPAGESILIDAGLPGSRDADRIFKTAQDAGLERIDLMVVTHFDLDHYGGVPDLAERIELVRAIDPGLPEKTNPIWDTNLNRYEEAVGDKREVLKPGDTLPVKQAEGSPELLIRCLGAQQKFVDAEGDETNDLCNLHEPKDKDTSQNANSVVLLLSFGDFRFLDAADLTWNLEHELVCPINRVGKVDVYQVDHHGLDASNNPVLVKSIEPTVAIANNGPFKGPGPMTFQTLATTPSIQAVYQVHRNLKNGPEGNTSSERIANDAEECEAAGIRLTVAPKGSEYFVAVPSKGLRETFQTKKP
jgi:beta-lactamase superfamily II metal-dependent hydrolase